MKKKKILIPLKIQQVKMRTIPTHSLVSSVSPQLKVNTIVLLRECSQKNNFSPFLSPLPFITESDDSDFEGWNDSSYWHSSIPYTKEERKEREKIRRKQDR